MKRRFGSLQSREDETLKNSIYVSVGVIVVILNAIQVTVLSCLKRKKTIYERFLLSLSVADLFFGFSNAIISITYLSDQKEIDLLYDIAYTIFGLCLVTSILHISWIALDRLWAVVFPFRHDTIVTVKKVHILIALTWTCTLIAAITLFVYQRLNFTYLDQTISTTNSPTDVICVPKNDSSIPLYNTTMCNTPSPPSSVHEHIRSRKLEGNTMWGISILILCADFIFIISYSGIIYEIRRTNKSQNRSGVGTNQNGDRKILIVCVIVALVFVLLASPFAVSRLATGSSPMWSDILLFMNPGANSIVYFFRRRCQKWCKSITNERMQNSGVKQKWNSNDSSFMSNNSHHAFVYSRDQNTKAPNTGSFHLSETAIREKSPRIGTSYVKNDIRILDSNGHRVIQVRNVLL